MLKVEVTSTLDEALSRLKRTVESDGVLHRFVEKTQFVSNSQKRRSKKAARQKTISFAKKERAIIENVILPRSVTK